MAVALPRSRSPSTLPPDRFEGATAGYVDRPQTGWGPVIGRERRRVRPMIALHPSRPHRRSNSDHPGKSTYSGEIDYRFHTFQTGYRFSGSRLTSLVDTVYLYKSSVTKDQHTQCSMLQVYAVRLSSQATDTPALVQLARASSKNLSPNDKIHITSTSCRRWTHATSMSAEITRLFHDSF